MRVTIRAPHVRADDKIRTHIGERVRAAFEHVESRVTSVQVVLVDENGPKGGVDKHVEVLANCGKLGLFRVDAKTNDLVASVDAALKKAQRAVEHAVDHKEGKRRAETKHRRP